MTIRRSRPLRGAAALAGVDEAEAGRRFDGKRVLIRLADDSDCEPDARETFLFALNLCLRFVDVAVQADDDELVDAAETLAREITGAELSTAGAPDVTLVVGSRVTHDSP